jgi:hypothetical protein
MASTPFVPIVADGTCASLASWRVAHRLVILATLDRGTMTPVLTSRLSKNGRLRSSLHQPGTQQAFALSAQ